MRIFQEVVVHEPGWRALLDPGFLVLVGVLLLMVGVMVHLAMHAGDSSHDNRDGDS